MASVNITGHLGKHPEVKVSESGNERVTFSVAENIYNPVTKEQEAVWWNVTMFGRRAQTVLEHFGKGDGIILDGKMGLPWVGDNGRVQMNLTAWDFQFPPRAGNGDDQESAESENDPFLG